MVPRKGLEPPHLSAPEPKSGASTNFATWAGGAHSNTVLAFTSILPAPCRSTTTKTFPLPRCCCLRNCAGRSRLSTVLRAAPMTLPTRAMPSRPSVWPAWPPTRRNWIGSPPDRRRTVQCSLPWPKSLSSTACRSSYSATCSMPLPRTWSRSATPTTRNCSIIAAVRPTRSAGWCCICSAGPKRNTWNNPTAFAAPCS